MQFAVKVVDPATDELRQTHKP